ncbi:hypothetical protein L873DRAFT_1793368 [Choiromyces venosus 120613-1]|uniref:Cell wall mannoprotein PIR1-like C-terminal domain-containing protein n=1 Tax=Choiromyces venosus 120613-1 TaxID=1336337 RepID=A0A3N4J642_9PEZI|nr:hypothetical protein L873DRAFT_1793368 [Choiromyces venosus 120613-1]
MNYISPKLLFVLIILFPLLALAVPDHEDLTGKRYPGGTPPGARRTLDHQFGIIQLPISARAEATGQSTACADRETANISIVDGVLKDSRGRVGCIVANRQFQFDHPPLQHDLLFSGGFSVQKNGLLALGEDDVFYACPCERDGGSKLYDMRVADYCYPVFLEIVKLNQC